MGFVASSTQTDEPNTTDCQNDVSVAGNTSRMSSLVEFSQSWMSLALSTLFLLVAFAAQQATIVHVAKSNLTKLPSEVLRFSSYEDLGRTPVLSPTLIYQLEETTSPTAMLLNSTIMDAYKNDGVICFRGLLSHELIERLDADTGSILQERLVQSGGPKKHSQFHTVEHSAMFRNISSNAREVQDFPALLQAALFSNISRVAAELLGLTSYGDTPKKTLRVIRDILLAKDNEEYTCGWHVDDMGFWPATPNSPGVNAWVALDDMELTEETGGFALAVGSHTARWRTAAYHWTGASINFPTGGYTDVADMFQRRTGHGTCNLKTSAPHIHQRMEETARIYRVRKGDVIFHTRWLFHKTVPVQRKGKTNRVYRRYSIRYGPGDDTFLPTGYGMEPSILWEPSNGGKSVNQVCQDDGPWYPLAWPHMDGLSTFASDLAALCEHKLPVALARRQERIKEMKPFLRKLAKANRS